MNDFIKIDEKFLPYCDHEYANREVNAVNCTEVSINIAILFAEWVLRQDITSRGIGFYVNYVGEIVSTEDLFNKYYQETYIEAGTHNIVTSEQTLCCCYNPNGFKEMEEGRETCSLCKKPY